MRIWLFACFLLLAGSVAMAEQGSGQSVVTQTSPSAKTQKPDPAVDESLQPVLHAKQAGVSTCLPTIAQEAKELIDTDHTAASSWSKSQPDAKTFYSGVGLSYKNQVAPNVFSLMVATPMADGCSGQTVQVYPTKRKCADIEKQLLANGGKIGQLQKIAYLQGSDASRIALIPGPSSSCTVVTIKTTP